MSTQVAVVAKAARAALESPLSRLNTYRPVTLTAWMIDDKQGPQRARICQYGDTGHYIRISSC